MDTGGRGSVVLRQENSLLSFLFFHSFGPEDQDARCAGLSRCVYGR